MDKCRHETYPYDIKDRKMKAHVLKILEGQFTIHRFSAETALPMEVLGSSFLSVTKTEEELSIVCDAAMVLDTEESVGGWSCIKVQGPLDFALTGILARLSSVLAEARISIFAISTYDTDYILLKSEKLDHAVTILEHRGYEIIR